MRQQAAKICHIREIVPKSSCDLIEVLRGFTDLLQARIVPQIRRRLFSRHFVV